MFQSLLKKPFLLLSTYATEPDDKDDVRIKKIIGISAALSAVFIYLGYGLVYYRFSEWKAFSVCLGICVLFFLGFLSFWKIRRLYAHLYYWLIIHIIGISVCHVLLGGFTQSGMVIIWILLPPTLSLVMDKPNRSFIWLLVVIVTFVLLTGLQPFYFRPENNFPGQVVTILSLVNIVGFGVYIFAILYYFVWQNEILTKLVLNEQAKTEGLLLNILPKDIAAILKNENRVIADQFESASVLFADVVNFTPMSASMTPTELVELLNEVYSHFDTLVEKYELEKIKTIGDCYMVAAGVPRRRPDHALVLTQLALDIRDFVSQHEFHGRQLKFRIGINSGSVVAGVIGRKKFAYDLWGDAVNTASRMESHGSGGFIQITEDTYNLINHDFNCEARGKVKVKGKGEINVWYVIEKLSP